MKPNKYFKEIILHVLRLICKYYIAYHMFSYAFAKILKTQFSLGPVIAADYNVSSYNGFMLTWYYYGFSRTYGLIIAGCQIIAGILILFRKTERIGIVLLLSFMVNIVLVNIFYYIAYGTMMMSITITTMGVFLFISDWNGFQSYFFRTRSNKGDSYKELPTIFTKYYWLPFFIISILLYFGYDYINEFAFKHKKMNWLMYGE